MADTRVPDTEMVVEIFTDGACWPNPGPGGRRFFKHDAIAVAN
jgi:hypothetical protein